MRPDGSGLCRQQQCQDESMSSRPTKWPRFPLSTIGLEIAITRQAIIDAQAALTFHRRYSEMMIVLILAKRTTCSPILPACTAATTRQKSYAIRICACQMSHRRQRPSGWAVRPKPHSASHRSLIRVSHMSNSTFRTNELGSGPYTPAKFRRYYG